MFEVIPNENYGYDFVKSDEYEYRLCENPPVLYLDRKVASQLFKYHKSISSTNHIKIDISEQSFKIYDMVDGENELLFMTKSLFIWYKFIDMLLKFPETININDAITITNGMIYAYDYSTELLMNHNGQNYVARLQKIYDSPFPKDKNYEIVGWFFAETAYKLTSEYKKIEAKSLKYFFGNTSAIIKSERMTDIKIDFF
jgi:hypothetical protein